MKSTLNLYDYLSFQDVNKRKLNLKDLKDAPTSALQVFEEDTRMSADSLFTSPNR